MPYIYYKRSVRTSFSDSCDETVKQTRQLLDVDIKSQYVLEYIFQEIIFLLYKMLQLTGCLGC